MRDALLLAGRGRKNGADNCRVAALPRLGRAEGAHSGWVLKLRLQQVGPGRRLVPTV